jgi:hypothetical protein
MIVALTPQAQAFAMIEDCEGDLEEAILCARLRAMNSATDDDDVFAYWMLVLRAMPRTIADLAALSPSKWN